MRDQFEAVPGVRFIWPLALALAAVVPAGAGARDREEVMKEAARFAEHSWEMRAANQKGTCPGNYRSDQTLGARKGVPYAWGGSMSLTEFDRRIAEGQGAGSHSRDGILSCVAGVDCSGFVSQVWQLPRRQSTSTLPSVTRPIGLDELRAGDALNKAGSHVVLFASLRDDGTPVIYEASGGAARVRMVAPGWSYLAGYQPIRYEGLEETVAQASQVDTSSPTPTAMAASAAPAVESAAAADRGTGTLTSGSAAAAQPAVGGGNRVTLRYGVDVGFEPALEDSQAVGPDYLAAGPAGLAAVYDRIRQRVVVLAREGIRGAFDAGNADGLGFTKDGKVIVMDGGLPEVRLHDSRGKLLSKFGIPRKGVFSALHLDDGILYATTPDGERKVVAELSDGKLRPPAPGVKVPKAVIKWKARASGGRGQIEVNGETVSVPESVHVSARPHGPWIELVLVATDARGGVRVDRTLRRRGQVVALPGGHGGAYSPIADLAVDAGKSAVYLEPGDKAVSVVWVDPAP